MEKLTFNKLLRYTKDITSRDVYSVSFTYVPAVLIAYLFIRFTRLKPNHVTVMGALCGIIGFLAGVVYGYYTLSIVLFFIYFLLDWVDGLMASAIGGSYLGIKLDTLTDRLVFVLYVFMLVNYHLALGESVQVIYLIVILVGYYMLDVIGMASANAKLARYTDEGLKVVPKNVSIDNSLKNIFLNFYNWFPNRLSLPFFIIVAFLLKESVFAYQIGVLVIASNFIKFFVETLNKKFK
ncbi:MAG: CDP-alcohol phosphatidyltransferase family protein [Bacteroidales bacterium]|nr:CDP-alcohol phosphatidyltransferase family protein [Bacteroidales bacterium]